jgi:hypothetical protein
VNPQNARCNDKNNVAFYILIKSAFVGERNLNVIKMHGTIIKKKEK